MFQVTDETEVTFSVSMDFAPTIGAARAARLRSVSAITAT